MVVVMIVLTGFQKKRMDNIQGYSRYSLFRAARE